METDDRRSGHRSPASEQAAGMLTVRAQMARDIYPASYLALPGSPLHAAPASLGALAPARPARPEPEPGVGGAHALLLVTVHAGAVTGLLRDVVHGVIADVAAGAVVAHQEVFKVSLRG